MDGKSNSGLVWQLVDTVLLDMDGTLLDLNFDRVFWRELVPQRYASVHGMSVSAAWALLEPLFRDKEGTLDWYCLDYWTRELGFDVLALKHEVAHLIRLHAGVFSFLKHLQLRNKRLLLVTNAHFDSLTLKLARTGIAGYFEAVFSSHEFGMPKEQVGFWDVLSERAAYDASRTVLVDDNVTVLTAARESGIAAQVAVRRPDSGAPRLTIEGFESVDSVAELLGEPAGA